MRESEQARPAPDAFDRLRQEHAVIQSLLKVIDALTDRADRGHDVEHHDLSTAIDFLVEYGELGHHEKEEGILTPVLIAHGFDWYRGPLAGVRREHRQEHYFLRVLAQLAQQPSGWSAEDRRRFVSVGREFTSFLRTHMQQEESDVFEVARTKLPADARDDLLAAFDRFDAEPERVRALEALESTRRQLLERYGP